MDDVNLKTFFSVGETLKVLNTDSTIETIRVYPNKNDYWVVRKVYPYYLELGAFIRNSHNKVYEDRRTATIGDLVMNGYGDRFQTQPITNGG